MIAVPNKFPTVEPGIQRIALIGEAPGGDEYSLGEPFVGQSGNHLSGQLSTAGFSIACCFKGNICQIRPPNNRISTFKWNGPEIQEGLAALALDLEKFNPNICVLLGNASLKAAKDPNTNHVLIPKLFHYKISAWRGSLFVGQGIFKIRKCIATYHPVYILRDFKVAPLLQFDLRRAIKESTFPELHLPQRLLKIDLSYEDIIDSLRQIRLAQLPVALDIEGGLDTMSCISFATMANFAFIVPFTRKDGTSVWSVEQECRILRELALTLEDPHVPKILQNAMYDTFVLQYSYHIRVRNVADDIMLKHWSLNAELRKSLALQASIYTREPYWKHERLQANDPQEKINAEENKEEGNDESEQ